MGRKKEGKEERINKVKSEVRRRQNKTEEGSRK